jgi:DNA modification methylase
VLEHENKILHGNALDKLKELESESVDTIITSPPYWALRDYKVNGQIGVEKTIDEYVSKLVNVFSEAKRVLKKEGTCWIVLGDSYGGTGDKGDYKDPKYENGRNGQRYPLSKNIYQKSLCMIPERFAIKMIDKGWIIRNKIIWHKKNCMPSSAKDRFTVDYEYIYFFTKSQKYYFKTQYEPLKFEPHAPGNKSHIPYANGEPQQGFIRNRNKVFSSPEGRIKRCVWSIPTKPFPEAHFAVFPEQLVKQCLDAGCPPEGTVLDPFMGSGTTALVSLKNNRKFTGIELNEDYIKIANKRIKPYLYQAKLI